MTNASTRDDANTDELTALKHLVAGHSIDFTATASRVSEDDVRVLARRYPNRASLADAIEALLQRADRAQVDDQSGPARK